MRSEWWGTCASAIARHLIQRTSLAGTTTLSRRMKVNLSNARIHNTQLLVESLHRFIHPSTDRSTATSIDTFYCCCRCRCCCCCCDCWIYLNIRDSNFGWEQGNELSRWEQVQSVIDLNHAFYPIRLEKFNLFFGIILSTIFVKHFECQKLNF